MDGEGIAPVDDPRQLREVDAVAIAQQPPDPDRDGAPVTARADALAFEILGLRDTRVRAAKDVRVHVLPLREHRQGDDLPPRLDARQQVAQIQVHESEIASGDWAVLANDRSTGTGRWP